MRNRRSPIRSGRQRRDRDTSELAKILQLIALREGVVSPLNGFPRLSALRRNSYRRFENYELEVWTLKRVHEQASYLVGFYLILRCYLLLESTCALRATR